MLAAARVRRHAAQCSRTEPDKDFSIPRHQGQLHRHACRRIQWRAPFFLFSCPLLLRLLHSRESIVALIMRMIFARRLDCLQFNYGAPSLGHTQKKMAPTSKCVTVPGNERCMIGLALYNLVCMAVVK